MKLRSAAVLILNRLKDNLQVYDKEVDRISRRENLSHKDRQLLYNIVKGVIQNQLYIDFLISLAYKRGIKSLERPVLNLLRVGVYQLIFLRVPSHAAVFETVEAAKEVCNLEVAKLVNAVLRNLPDRGQVTEKLSRLGEIKRLSIEYSHPEWLVKRWMRQFGREGTEELLRFNNSVYRPTFRHNPVKGCWDDLKGLLKKQGFDVKERDIAGFHFFYVDSPGRLLKSDVFRKRFCSVQDFSQALPVFLLNLEEGDVVLDCCAGLGGKATLMAQLVKRVRIYANDVSSYKQDFLRKEIEVLGLRNIELLNLDASEASFPEVDKTLVDVPCTATGTIVKNVDVRWNRTPFDLQKLPELQFRILNNVARYVASKGSIVYCTCSLEYEENWSVIDKFLQGHREYRVDPAWNYVSREYCDERGAIFILPHRHKMTGSFAVRLIKYCG